MEYNLCADTHENAYEHILRMESSEGQGTSDCEDWRIISANYIVLYDTYNLPLIDG